MTMRRMKNQLLALIFLAVVLGVGNSAASPVNFAIGVVDGTTSDSLIQFTGSTTNPSRFTFVNAVGGAGDSRAFVISSPSSESSIVGLFGQINGQWDIGSISSPVAGLQVASITGGNPGFFRIYQDSTAFVQALITFLEIATYDGAGSVSGSGTLNLSGWQTGGIGTIDNPGLLNLMSLNDGEASVSFTFTPSKTLSEIVGSAVVLNTSFSGAVATVETAVPEPGSIALVFPGFALLLFTARARRANKH